MFSVNLKATICAIALVVCGGLAQADEYPKIKMKMGHFLPATFAQADVDQWFADEVKRRSNGAIEIEIFWAGAMGSAAELLGLASAGAMELAAFPKAYYPRQFGLSGVGSLPRVFGTVEQAHELMTRVFALPAVQAEHRATKLKLLMSHFSNPYRIACNKPVEELGALQGYRVRSTGEYIPVVFRSLGMVPVNTPANEVYESLDRGNLNCTMLSYDQMYSMRMYEVAKYASDINLGALATWQIWMNAATFDRYPKKVQELLLEVGRDAMTRDVSVAVEALRVSEKALAEKGVMFQPLKQPEKFRETVPSALEAWAKKMSGQGQAAPVEAILNVVKESAAAVR